MGVTLAPIRPILTVADICDLLRISKSQFYELKREGFFDRHNLLQPVEPDIDSGRRYLGEPFVRFLDTKQQTKALRAALREVAEAGR